MPRIFLSYSSKDAETATRLVKKLAEAGHEIWIDKEIRGGELWKRRVVEAIDEADIFIVLLSSNSVASNEVRRELDIAESRRKLILPAVISPVKMPPEGEYSLAGVQKVDLSGDLEAGAKDLLNAIRAYLAVERKITNAN